MVSRSCFRSILGVVYDHKSNRKLKGRSPDESMINVFIGYDEERRLLIMFYQRVLEETPVNQFQ